jgi:glutamine---fructose-6-phosphate transaminase (isomerizing)
VNAAPHQGRHGTTAEIWSQPDIWAAAVDEAGRAAAAGLPDLTAFADVVFTGCGSTYYLSQWASVHARSLFGLPATAVPSSELLLHLETWVPRPPTLLVAISRSARTTETVRAVRAFRARGLGEVAVVTCAPEEALAEAATWVLGVPSAMEDTVPQTRSFTAMMLALSRLLSGAPARGVVEGVIHEGQRLLSTFEDGLPGAVADTTAYTFLGTGSRYGLAAEAMLKVKEMSLSPAEAFQTLDFRHGPISTVGGHSVVVGLLPDSPADHEVAVLDDVADLGGQTFALGPDADAAGDRHVAVTFASRLPPPWRDVLYLPAIHQTAFAAATARGRDPDHPSNLQAVVILDD